MSLRAGDTVEHFVIVSPLGEGGMGQVYVARDTRLQRSIALKIMQPEPAGDASGKGASNGAARLLREAQSAAGLEHPNVVTIYEVGEIKGEGEEAGRPFIAMELVKGRPLRAFVGDEHVPMRERIRWLADIGRALAAAHKAGLVHRDIKPENVMVRDDGVIKVLDFGLAKRAASTSNSSSSSTEAQVLPSLTGKGVAIGTPYYMAPEQMRNEVLDGRADQFAWGVVAYELLSGTPAWGRDIGALELVAKLLSEDPAPLAELRPDVPAHVAAVVTRALSKRKGARFETMEAAVVALEDAGGVFAPTLPRIAVSTPEPSEVQPPAAMERGTTTVSLKPAGRRRWLFALGAAGVLAVSGLAFVAGAKRATRAAVVASASQVAPARECARSTQCVAKLDGKPAVCNPAGRCAAIESEDCKALFEPDDLKRDDTIWIGTLTDRSGLGAQVGEWTQNSVDLGRRDFAQAMGAYASSNHGPADPAIAVAACDLVGDRIRATHHLVDDVGVPAVVGFDGNPAVTIELATGILVPKGVLTLETMTLSPLLANIPHGPNQPRLVWRTTYDATQTARAIGALVVRLEAQLRASHALGAGHPLRVATVRTKTQSANAFAEALFAALRFNGKSALDNGDDYLEIAFDPPGGADGAIATLVAGAPDIVIAHERDLIPRIETAWKTGARRPVYLTNTGFDDTVLRFAGTNRELRARLYGVSSVSTTNANARFVLHYNETYAPPMTRTASANSAYDAFYLIAYAILANEETRPTGELLSRSIASRLLPPGTPIDVGPSGIYPALNALRRGEHLDLHGSTGHLAFDAKTGDAPFDLAILCPAVDAKGVAVGSLESGLVYGGSSGALSGEPRCP